MIGHQTISGWTGSLRLPADAPVIDLRFDDGDLIAECANGEIFRIDTETMTIKAN